MDPQLERELERLTGNAALRREDLLNSGLNRSKRRKQLTILSGVLALTSAATITAVITKLFGTDGMLIVSALVVFISGTISLVVAVHYADDEIVGRLAGASKYLALRDSVFRFATDPDTTDKLKRESLAALQAEYANLDTTYSKYFTKGGNSRKNSMSSLPPKYNFTNERTIAAAEDDVRKLHQNIERGENK
jgi:hypothetical protein